MLPYRYQSGVVFSSEGVGRRHCAGTVELFGGGRPAVLGHLNERLENHLHPLPGSQRRQLEAQHRQLHSRQATVAAVSKWL